MTLAEIRAAIAEGTREWAEVEKDRIQMRDEALRFLRARAREARSEIRDRRWHEAAELVDEMRAVCSDWGDSGDLPEAVMELEERASRDDGDDE